RPRLVSAARGDPAAPPAAQGPQGFSRGDGRQWQQRVGGPADRRLLGRGHRCRRGGVSCTRWGAEARVGVLAGSALGGPAPQHVGHSSYRSSICFPRVASSKCLSPAPSPDKSEGAPALPFRP
ncbi:unnamed protein product, partial [Prorocentrum cordatum]